jgi:uroporphyrinogen-III decarboxylase
MSTISRRDYVWKVFERQCEIALQNLQTIYEQVGDRIHILFLSGTDFGTQAGPFISPKSYRSLYMPFNKQLNDWVHKNTTWKTFIHSCGSVAALIPDFIQAGFDVINPVQTTAADMEARSLKQRFGKDIVFWGGGVDTQHTLPFGTPDEVRTQVKERMRIFGPAGGFVFNTVHNVQARTPVENILAMYQTVRDHGSYPLG